MTQISIKKLLLLHGLLLLIQQMQIILLHHNLGLRYQLQIGSEDQNNDHAISTGAYGISEIGTLQKLKRLLKNLKRRKLQLAE